MWSLAKHGFVERLPNTVTGQSFVGAAQTDSFAGAFVRSFDGEAADTADDVAAIGIDERFQVLAAGDGVDAAFDASQQELLELHGPRFAERGCHKKERGDGEMQNVKGHSTAAFGVRCQSERRDRLQVWISSIRAIVIAKKVDQFRYTSGNLVLNTGRVVYEPFILIFLSMITFLLPGRGYQCLTIYRWIAVVHSEAEGKVWS